MDTPEELRKWLDREAELRKRGQAGVGVAQPQQVARLSGLQILEGILHGELPAAPMAQTLSFQLVEVEPGRVTFQGEPGPAHLNPMGGIHGGWYATLLDSALGCAVMSRLAPGRSYATAELSLSLVRGIGSGTPRVRAQAEVLHCGRQLATAQGRLYGPDGTLYAHGTATCLVFDLPAARN